MNPDDVGIVSIPKHLYSDDFYFLLGA